MEQSEIAKRVLDVARTRKIINETSIIDLDVPLLEGYGISSLNIVKLIVSLETEFSIEFDDASLDLSNFKTFKNIVGLVCKKLDNI